MYARENFTLSQVTIPVPEPTLLTPEPSLATVPTSDDGGITIEQIAGFAAGGAVIVILLFLIVVISFILR